MAVKWCRPFYDGLGKPLLGATVTLRDENGTIVYTCTELKTPGYVGCYSADVSISNNYWIWYQEAGSSVAIKLEKYSPVFIPSDDIPAIS